MALGYRERAERQAPSQEVPRGEQEEGKAARLGQEGPTGGGRWLGGAEQWLLGMVTTWKWRGLVAEGEWGPLVEEVGRMVRAW